MKTADELRLEIEELVEQFAKLNDKKRYLSQVKESSHRLVR